MVLVTVYETKEEFMLSKYNTILTIMFFMTMAGYKNKSGNAIAKEVKSMSRATVYRTLKKMEDAGLVVCYRMDGGYSWHKTQMGHDFWEGYRELSI